MQCVRVNIIGGPKGPGEKDGVSHKFSAKKTTELLFRALDKIDLMFNKQLDAWRASDNYLRTPPTLSVWAGGTMNLCHKVVDDGNGHYFLGCENGTTVPSGKPMATVVSSIADGKSKHLKRSAWSG